MQEVFRAIGRLSQSHITVLINGESGTGKISCSCFTQALPRRAKPFIALNMAAIPKDLIETELFGHEKALSQGQILSIKAALNRQMAEHCSLMKLVICHLKLRLDCFAYSLTVSSIV